MKALPLIKEIMMKDPNISDIDLTYRVYGSILKEQGRSLEELSAIGILALVNERKLPAFDSIPRLKRMAIRSGRPSTMKQKLKLF